MNDVDIPHEARGKRATAGLVPRDGRELVRYRTEHAPPFVEI
jgi:hypothetical protein